MKFFSTLFLASFSSSILFILLVCKNEIYPLISFILHFDRVVKFFIAFFIFYFPIYTLLVFLFTFILKTDTFYFIKIFFKNIKYFYFFIFIYLICFFIDFNFKNDLHFNLCLLLTFFIAVFLHNFIVLAKYQPSNL